ncbi:MAG: ParB N-terminal domain-containing protein [Salinisphaera sp.]|nr:ParB N-terminal domain-containing protein [Salinisphaera sp.]
MELELHQLELRYERLRKRQPSQERQLVGSLADVGQQMPIVVVAAGEGAANRYVVIDGYKRVRAMKRLACDTVRGTRWELSEVEALLLERRLRAGSEDAFDQAWLLAELRERFGLSLAELAARLQRSTSWVSRRLGLLESLPASVHDQVRAGAFSAYAAMKYLLPLARANAQAASRLAEALAPLKPTSRQVAALYAGWQSGTPRTRELILASPQIYLAAAAAQSSTAAPSVVERWLADLGALAGIARRVHRALEEGVLEQLWQPGEQAAVEERFAAMRAAVQRLCDRFDVERGHAR